MRQLSEPETQSKAFEATKYNLFELVGDEVFEWDEDTLQEEAWYSAEIIVSEASMAHPEIQGLIHDRALTIWKDDMPRAPMEHLATDDPETAVLEMDFWPNSMNKWDLWEILAAQPMEEIPTDCISIATDEVMAGIYDKLTDIPEREEVA